MRKFAASSILVAALFLAPFARGELTEGQVMTALRQASTMAAVISPKSVIAVLDREGFVLAVWHTGPGDANPGDVANAISKAGAAAYLSSNGHAFTSRTAGFIVQQHFPPGINNTPPGPLVGVNFSNLPFSDVNYFKIFTLQPNRPNVPLISHAPSFGLGGTPGGVPLYANGRLIGGLGVAGDGDGPLDVQVEQRPDRDEIVALAGQRGFEPPSTLIGSLVTINGFRLAYVETDPSSIQMPPIALTGSSVTGYTVQGSPPISYPSAVLGGVTGEVRQPIMSDPEPGTIEGQRRLSAAEVSTMLGQAAARAEITRAGIRLPAGRPAQVFVTVVNRPVLPNVPAKVLGTFRTPDATLFSWDVAVQKARTALYFSSKTLAFSTRAAGFLAQNMFPPGIDNTGPGPLSGFQERVSDFPLFGFLPAGPNKVAFNPLSGATVPQPPNFDPVLTNGITIFPGGFPLYRNGVLIGAIGVSGDGVDQDDLIAMSGAAGFLPPERIRSDQFQVRGARLPYAKFPRNPTL